MALSGCARRTESSPTPPLAPSPALPAPRDARADKLLVTETEYRGWRTFQVHCARCHGDDALGGLTAPNLTVSVSAAGPVTRDSFFVIVQRGPTSKDMQGFRVLLDDEQIGNIYAYLKARSEGRLGRGRPHRAPTSP